ncbi:MAG: hypothetical protein ABL866_12050 [Devosia sp.]
MFRLKDYWVWDFWIADDGDRFHLFYLHARRSLGDPELRHRNARIGHATSTDLTDWQNHGEVLAPGAAGSFDETATWTGSVVRGADGLWRMFYTGSSFIAPNSARNIEAIGVAVSDDLHSWRKLPGPICRADPRWYETLGTSTWPEEAWRDPWVFPDLEGDGWHMLITARANYGEDAGRGVIAHAFSPDMQNWDVRPQLSLPEQGFGHLEVPQTVAHDGKIALIFCCNAPRLSNHLSGQIGGIWVAPAASLAGPFDISRAQLLASERLYAGRLVRDRKGDWVLMGFHLQEAGGKFEGGVSDPLPLRWDGETGLPVMAEPI